MEPPLGLGDVMVVDGLGAHRAREARRAVEARGAKCWVLPAYSPDLSPVGEAGAKVKGEVRKAEPHTQAAATHEAIGEAIGHVTRSDAQGWLGHQTAYPA